MIDPLPAPPSEPFERSGGELCLDFTNTWGDRGRPGTDRLGTYEDLLAFTRSTCDLQAPDLDALRALALAHPHRASAALRRALDLRDALYGLFSAQARGRVAAAEDLAHLNGRLGSALAHLQLGTGKETFHWVWSGVSRHLDAPLWPILRSAADLLTSPRRDWVRECDGTQCTWLFLDLSRAHSRRWCSMSSCGNRAKARRHYRRKAS